MSTKFPDIQASECCKCVVMTDIPATVVEEEPGITSYYRKKCGHCDKPCHEFTAVYFDDGGLVINDGDIVESPSQMDAWRWHAVRLSADGRIEIRDLNANNVHMWDEPIFNRGPYWNHLDKLSDVDLDYYWGTTREEAEAKKEISNMTWAERATFIRESVESVFGNLLKKGEDEPNA